MRRILAEIIRAGGGIFTLAIAWQAVRFIQGDVGLPWGPFLFDYPTDASTIAPDLSPFGLFYRALGMLAWVWLALVVGGASITLAVVTRRGIDALSRR